MKLFFLFLMLICSAAAEDVRVQFFNGSSSARHMSVDDAATFAVGAYSSVTLDLNTDNFPEVLYGQREMTVNVYTTAGSLISTDVLTLEYGVRVLHVHFGVAGNYTAIGGFGFGVRWMELVAYFSVGFVFFSLCECGAMLRRMASNVRTQVGEV